MALVPPRLIVPRKSEPYLTPPDIREETEQWAATLKQDLRLISPANFIMPGITMREAGEAIMRAFGHREPEPLEARGTNYDQPMAIYPEMPDIG